MAVEEHASRARAISVRKRELASQSPPVLAWKTPHASSTREPAPFWNPLDVEEPERRHAKLPATPLQDVEEEAMAPAVVTATLAGALDPGNRLLAPGRAPSSSSDIPAMGDARGKLPFVGGTVPLPYPQSLNRPSLACRCSSRSCRPLTRSCCFCSIFCASSGDVCFFGVPTTALSG